MQGATDSDDVLLSENDELWRLIQPDKAIFNENLDRFVPTSYAFTDSEASAMSVTVAKLYLASGRTVANYFDRFEKDGYGLASVTYGIVKELGLEIQLDITDDDPGHALVNGKKTRGIRKRLAKASEWVVPPSTGRTD